MSVPTDTYQSTYRRSGLAFLGIALSLLIGIGGVIAALLLLEDEAMIKGVFAGFIFTLAGLAGSLIACLRKHCWTLEAGGLHISEGPRVPLTGLRRRILLPYADIASLHLIRRGFEEIIEITTRNGTRHRLSPGRGKEFSANQIQGIHHFDTEGLRAFAARLQQALGTLDGSRPALRLANHFWTRPGGLALQGGLLLVTLALSIAVVWAVFFGEGTHTHSPNTSKAIGVLIFLPVILVWSIRHSLRHAREVRQQDQGKQ